MGGYTVWIGLQLFPFASRSQAVRAGLQLRMASNCYSSQFQLLSTLQPCASTSGEISFIITLKSQGYCGARLIPLHKFRGEYNHVSIYLFIGSLKIIVPHTYVQSLCVCVPALAAWSLDIINGVFIACEVHFLFPLFFLIFGQI